MRRFQQGPFDQSRLIEHKSEGTVFGHPVSVDLGDFSPCQAFLVEQFGPVESLRPALKHLDIQTIIANVMEAKLDVMFHEILACHPARVATLDAKYRKHDVLVQIPQYIV